MARGTGCSIRSGRTPTDGWWPTVRTKRRTRVTSPGHVKRSDGRATPLSMYAIDPLADEMRTALRWSVTRGSARDALALAGGLDQWWRERGLAREGRLWLFRAYERIAATGAVVPEVELASAY